MSLQINKYRQCFSPPEILVGDKILIQDINKILKKLKIPYWLDGGSLIGALRHKSFIPWDDDIDLCTFEKDFVPKREQFKKAVEALGYKFEWGKGTLDTYYQIFFTRKNYYKILMDAYNWSENKAKKNTTRYMKKPQPYLDILIFVRKSRGKCNYKGNYWKIKNLNISDILPVKHKRLFNKNIPVPRNYITYLKHLYKTDKNIINNVSIYAEHKAGAKNLCTRGDKLKLSKADFVYIDTYLKNILS